MQTKIGISLLLLMMLIACTRCGVGCYSARPDDKLTYHDPLKIHPLKVFYNPAIIDQTEAAMQMWNSLKSNGPIFETSDKVNAKIEIYDLEDAKRQNLYPAYTRTLEEMSNSASDTQAITYAPGFNGKCITITKSNTWYVIAHELGHCLGFSHDPNPDSIMFACVKDHQQITDEIKQDLKNVIEPPILPLTLP